MLTCHFTLLKDFHEPHIQKHTLHLSLTKVTVQFGCVCSETSADSAHGITEDVKLLPHYQTPI